MSDAPTSAPSVEDRNSSDYRKMLRTRRTLIAVLVVLVLMLLLGFFFLLKMFQPLGDVASTEEAGGLQWVKSIYGWGLTPDKQLSAPADVAVGPDSIIWTTDQGFQRIIGFNPDGSLAGIIGPGAGTPTPTFRYPNSLAVGEDGRIYVGDQYANALFVVTKSGEVLSKIYVPRPTAVAVRGDHIVVGSASGFVIMDKEGNPIRVVGSNGSGPDQFNMVKGVAIGKDGKIYVSDQYNNRVSAYDAEGNRLWIKDTGKPGSDVEVRASSGAQTTTTAEAKMQLPSGLTLDNAGRLVVSDPFGFNLVVLNAKVGSLIAKYGESGSKDGQFVYQSGVNYDPKYDWFAAADTQNGRVQLVRLPGSSGT
ncbi:MAG: NHL repeat-containing protein, partial [Actinomycetes bacterium]